MGEVSSDPYVENWQEEWNEDVFKAFQEHDWSLEEENILKTQDERARKRF